MSINFRPIRWINGQWCPSSGISGVNVTNCNAADILAALGLNPDPYGPAITLEVFEAECATFLRIAAGTEADVARPESKQGNWTDCGRRAGYLSDRIRALGELSKVGLAAGATHMGT